MLVIRSRSGNKEIELQLKRDRIDAGKEVKVSKREAPKKTTSCDLVAPSLRLTLTTLFFPRFPFCHRCFFWEVSSLLLFLSATSTVRTQLIFRFFLVRFAAGESGKSTVLKQFKLVHTGSYQHGERTAYREIIFSNLIQSMRFVHSFLVSTSLPLLGHPPRATLPSSLPSTLSLPLIFSLASVQRRRPT